MRVDMLSKRSCEPLLLRRAEAYPDSVSSNRVDFAPQQRKFFFTDMPKRQRIERDSGNVGDIGKPKQVLGLLSQHLEF